MALKTVSTDVFYAQTTMMQWVTMWPAPFKRSSVKLAVNVFSWNLTVLLAVTTLGLIIKALSTKNLVARSEAIYILTLVGTSIHRVLYYRRHHGDLFWLYQRGRELARDCPKDWLKYTGIISQLYCLAGFGAVIVWLTGPLVEDLSVNRSIRDTKIPLSIYIPIEISGSLFLVVYLLCCISVIAAAHIYLAADTFFFTMIRVANGSIKTLRTKLKSMRGSKIYESSSLAHVYVKSLAKDHICIVEYLRKIDLTYRTLIVYDVLHGLISLTFAILTLSESKSFFEWMKMIIFVGYCVFHHFINSFFGQHLFDQQTKLFTDLHTVPWTDYNVEFRKSFHIMQMGMMNPIMLSAWRVFYLQYRTFMDFAKNILSYYMVLRQVANKK